MEEELIKRLKGHNPRGYSVLELCNDKEGSGFDFINNSNREAFYPLLMAIEETIALNFKRSPTMKDAEVIESIKKIRDNIFNENFTLNELEKEIVIKIKQVLFLNKYNKRDVLLSISHILNSARRHRAVDGSKGYLTFVADMFDKLEKVNSKKDDADLWEKGVFAERINPKGINKKMRTFYMSHDEEMNFNCKECGTKISAHNKDWHDEMCDTCFKDKCRGEVYVKDE